MRRLPTMMMSPPLKKHGGASFSNAHNQGFDYKKGDDMGTL